MNCKQVHEEFFGLASDGAVSPELDSHVRHCAACARDLAEFRATMSLLDEWKAPEPSPYFSARLRTRLRDEAEAPRTIGAWWRDAMSPFTTAGRRVALGAAMALLLVAGVVLYQPSHAPVHTANPAAAATAAAQTGSAVADLQALDKHGDLFANFDLLDDVQN